MRLTKETFDPGDFDGDVDYVSADGSTADYDVSAGSTDTTSD